ncbi:hypothetical protein K503DRAFT_801055 [Rhizopogon vinicolor AM-OR11-026]|uniref:Uncharacterized protein n=1 Tax=Rhizopogon vinicolor AM-OR11-026 TaxID=1314800 RepID=A0A1B7MYL3_9AGAM|nr:hypothetical protein K503DRAFT_801055 [Rhizopogon vinicolor AM-OR11-026]
MSAHVINRFGRQPSNASSTGSGVWEEDHMNGKIAEDAADGETNDRSNQIKAPLESSVKGKTAFSSLATSLMKENAVRRVEHGGNTESYVSDDESVLEIPGHFRGGKLVERQDDVDGHASAEDRRPRWSTPAYPEPIDNVLPEFISFSEHPFTVSPSSLFPIFADTNAYLKAFTLSFIESGYIRLSHEAIGVEEVHGSGWVVRMKDWNKGGGTAWEGTWYALDITTMWFNNPTFPT